MPMITFPLLEADLRRPPRTRKQFPPAPGSKEDWQPPKLSPTLQEKNKRFRELPQSVPGGHNREMRTPLQLKSFPPGGASLLRFIAVLPAPHVLFKGRVHLLSRGRWQNIGRRRFVLGRRLVRRLIYLHAERLANYGLLIVSHLKEQLTPN